MDWGRRRSKSAPLRSTMSLSVQVAGLEGSSSSSSARASPMHNPWQRTAVTPPTPFTPVLSSPVSVLVHPPPGDSGAEGAGVQLLSVDSLQQYMPAPLQLAGITPRKTNTTTDGNMQQQQQQEADRRHLQPVPSPTHAAMQPRSPQHLNGPPSPALHALGGPRSHRSASPQRGAMNSGRGAPGASSRAVVMSHADGASPAAAASAAVAAAPAPVPSASPSMDSASTLR